MQRSILDEILSDDRPIAIWIRNASALVSKVYEHDSSLARQLEQLVRRLASTAADLDCIRTDDPSAPSVDASAKDTLRYLMNRYSDYKREYRQVFARVDQVVGRATVRRVMGA